MHDQKHALGLQRPKTLNYSFKDVFSYLRLNPNAFKTERSAQTSEIFVSEK
jgi:hypothetical protein